LFQQQLILLLLKPPPKPSPLKGRAGWGFVKSLGSYKAKCRQSHPTGKVPKRMKITQDFFIGAKDSTPIALGYLPIAIAFGVLAGTVGLPAHLAVIMSVLVFAGASQLIALNLLKLGTDPYSIIFTTFVVNLRHFLMSASLAERLKGVIPRKTMSALFLGLTDESFSLLSLTKQEKLTKGYILGVNLIAYLAWVSGTLLGAYLGAGLPETLTNSMGISLYAMFIALLIPEMKSSRAVLVIALTSMLISSLLTWAPEQWVTVSTGWKIIISTAVAALVGTLAFTDGEMESNDSKPEIGQELNKKADKITGPGKT